MFKQSGQAWMSAATAKPWPPPCLEGCPKGLVELINKCLAWHPSDRITAAEAKAHSFLQPPAPLRVRVAAQPGKNGVGTIAEADLDPDLLRYLQTCPSWNSVAEKRLKTGATMSKCVRGDEAALGLKTEIAGIVDEENPRSAAP